MASKRENNPNVPSSIMKLLFSRLMILAVWIPVVLITVAHYTTSHEYHWVHDILRRVYYLPIVVAALRTGLIGGLLSAGSVSLAYMPHAFIALHHFDPARSLEKALEIVLYFIVGAVAGYLSDQERKRSVELQRSLNEQTRLTGQLVRAGRLSALGEVVAGIAHEVKNPLHSLAGTAEIVDPLIPKDTSERRMWEIHRSEISRLGRVAERFLSFAKPTPIEAVDVDLRDVIKRITELVSAQARQSKIQIETISSDVPVIVKGDLDQLAQVGLNIILNGINAIGDSEGTIRLFAETAKKNDETMACMTIENNGPAILEEDLEHLFDPFHSRSDSTGLGLSISSRIAEQHGGFIEAGNGSFGVFFTLCLVLADQK